MRARRRRGGDREAGCGCERAHHSEQECTALGFDWEIPETVRRRLRSFRIIENGPDTRLTAAGWKLHRANPRRKPGAKRAPKLLIANLEEVKEA
jgi:hypothetical protein